MREAQLALPSPIARPSKRNDGYFGNYRSRCLLDLEPTPAALSIAPDVLDEIREVEMQWMDTAVRLAERHYQQLAQRRAFRALSLNRRRRPSDLSVVRIQQQPHDPPPSPLRRANASMAAPSNMNHGSGIPQPHAPPVLNRCVIDDGRWPTRGCEQRGGGGVPTCVRVPSLSSERREERREVVRPGGHVSWGGEGVSRGWVTERTCRMAEGSLDNGHVPVDLDSGPGRGLDMSDDLIMDRLCEVAARFYRCKGSHQALVQWASSSRERRAFRVLAYSLRLRHAFRRFARRSAGSRRSCRGALPVSALPVLLVRLVGGVVRHGWERLLLPMKVEVAFRRVKALIGVVRSRALREVAVAHYRGALIRRSLIALMRNVLAAHSDNGQREGRQIRLPYRGSECAVDGRVVRAFVRWRYAARLAEPNADGQLLGPQPFPTLSGLHLYPHLPPAQLPGKRLVCQSARVRPLAGVGGRHVYSRSTEEPCVSSARSSPYSLL
ncbi:unnamed protein product [Vitrella brassicaformis CCMP3155]|uniref:Uncharacterized protein n=1 Tax=Vitrella brassicaformis (strain CCMP3155) TaxID=1169540 RepID=A0A0G4GCU1_VITBC|nr:unnamed protein product [Vitrella brassicaformis CCMP3155]|eukprot:CEM26964.1 unnamed protein product [Vitrella brassicaformis CCMP3155]